jgi:lactam utilization protein B
LFIEEGNDAAMPKRIISLDEKESIELQGILLDGDEKAALEFLRKIEEKSRPSKSVCRPWDK